MKLAKRPQVYPPLPKLGTPQKRSLIVICDFKILFLLYRRLALGDKVTRDELPRIYSIINDFSAKISINPPDVSLTHQKYLSPFVVGVKYCTIVLYPNLLEILDFNEKEVMLHHELSHIKRRDNLIGWIAMILRDIMFFNPFAYIAYMLIRTEQDSGSDKIVVKYSIRPVKEIAMLTKAEKDAWNAQREAEHQKIKDRITNAGIQYPAATYWGEMGSSEKDMWEDRMIRAIDDLASCARSGFRLTTTATITGPEFVTFVDTLTRDYE